MNNWSLNNYLIFTIVSFLFITSLIGIIYFICLKHKKGSKFFTGLILGLNTKAIISISFVLINFVYLSFFLIFKLKCDIPLVLISEILVLLSFIITFDLEDLFVNLFINAVSISLLYFSSLVVILRTGSDEVIFYILQILMNFFGLLFYMFTTLKFLKNICKKRSTQ